ncbi:hypothetical protein [Rhodovulum sulfidophilum]|uniref:hypothetical protein n=1 Tax=Rhodovulum sulfidophilum TaxID=35806 RepID=UPI0015B95ECB|nr:hypothetical protein [Rhodovulum sulfidophilum]
MNGLVATADVVVVAVPADMRPAFDLAFQDVAERLEVAKRILIKDSAAFDTAGNALCW